MPRRMSTACSKARRTASGRTVRAPKRLERTLTRKPATAAAAAPDNASVETNSVSAAAFIDEQNNMATAEVHPPPEMHAQADPTVVQAVVNQLIESGLLSQPQPVNAAQSTMPDAHASYPIPGTSQPAALQPRYEPSRQPAQDNVEAAVENTLSNLLGEGIQTVSSLGQPRANNHSNCPQSRELVLTMEKLLIGNISLSSQTTYKRAINLLFQFSTAFFPNMSMFPTSPALLANFIANLFAKNYAASTISTYTAAITTIHKLANKPDPSNSFLVKKMLSGAQKLKGQQDKRLPITQPILNTIIQSLYSTGLTHYDCLLFTSMFLIAFHAFLRVGEITVKSAADTGLHTIHLTNVKFHRKKNTLVSLDIILKHWKASCSAPLCTINIPRSLTGKQCPVQSLAAYLKLRGSKPGPLFIGTNKQPITRQKFASTLNICLHKAGIHNQYTSHSFRIGAATTAAIKGFTHSEIQRLGRWKSDAFLKYIRINTFQSI